MAEEGPPGGIDLSKIVRKAKVTPDTRTKPSNRNLADLTTDEGVGVVESVIKLANDRVRSSEIAEMLGFNTRSIQMLVRSLKEEGEIKPTSLEEKVTKAVERGAYDQEIMDIIAEYKRGSKSPTS